MAQMYLKGLADKYGFSLDTPVCELSDDVVDKLLYGTHGEKIHLEYKREDGGGSFNAPLRGHRHQPRSAATARPIPTP